MRFSRRGVSFVSVLPLSAHARVCAGGGQKLTKLITPGLFRLPMRFLMVSFVNRKLTIMLLEGSSHGLRVI
jgi:hypothetical protein